MSRLLSYHEVLTDGVGKCSVPMWSGYGGDAGFCDKPAYGLRPDGKTHVRWDGYEYREDGLYAGYVPALACPAHGGPKAPVCETCKGRRFYSRHFEGNEGAPAFDADDQPCPECNPNGEGVAP